MDCRLVGIMVLAATYAIGCSAPSSNEHERAAPGTIETSIEGDRVDGDIPVTFYNATKGETSFGGLDKNRLADVIRDRFGLVLGKTLYRAAEARMAPNTSAALQVVVYLLHKDSYDLDVVRITITPSYDITDVLQDYVEGDGEIQTYDDTYGCPDETVDFVFGTKEVGYPTAKAAVESVTATAKKAGYKVVQLLGSKASINAYKGWLTCKHLMGLGNVGHGTQSGILLSGGTLRTSYFEGLSSKALACKALVFNSCLVHNDPLEPAIVSTGVSAFVGGNKKLVVGTSEDVFTCVFEDQFKNKGDMQATLKKCVSKVGYDPKGWGFSGNGPSIWKCSSASERDGGTDSGNRADAGQNRDAARQADSQADAGGSLNRDTDGLGHADSGNVPQADATTQDGAPGNPDFGMEDEDGGVQASADGAGPGLDPSGETTNRRDRTASRPFADQQEEWNCRMVSGPGTSTGVSAIGLYAALAVLLHRRLRSRSREK